MNYPIVFDRFETDFSTLGLAVLSEASGVKVKSVVNGELTMTMVYPRNGSKWPHIAADNFIQVDGQLFRIRGLEEQRDASGKLTSNIQCEHVWYDAGNCKFIPLFEQIGATPTAILEAAFADTRFVVGSVDSSLANTDIVLSKTNPAAVVSQLIELVGGELVRDNWTIGLAVRCGSDQGVEFRASKNLGTVKRTTDAKTIVTRLYPYGADDIDITSVNSGLAYLDSPYISNYDYIHSGSIDYGDIEDPTELKTKALTEFSTAEKDGIDKPKITYQVDVVELAKLAGVRYESFGLGDTMRIVDSDIGIDVNARIMEYEWYPYEPKRSGVTLANFRENIGKFLVSLSDTRAQVQRMTTHEGKIKAAWMENLRAKLQTEIEAGLSKRIVSHDYGDLWVDDLDAPTKAMVIVNGVFAIANSKKVDGDWDWKTFGNGDGFTADLINAGKIRLSEGLTVENDDGTFVISSTGLVVKLASNAARSVLAPDAFALQVNVAGEWVNAIWFDPITGKYWFNGELSADVITAIKAQIDVVISNTVIINNLTAQKGYIAELTTDRHDTSDMVYRYNLQPGDPDYALRKAPVKYQRMNDEVRERVVATYAGDLEGGVENRVQCVNRAGDLLYYLDATKTGITEDETDWPVWRFVYDGPDGLGIVKEREYFDTDGTNHIPAKRHGAGNGVGDNGTMTEAKWADRYEQKYITTGAGSLPAGTEVSIGLTDDGIVFSPDISGSESALDFDRNTVLKSVTSAETVVASKSIVFAREIKAVIGFSCDIAIDTAGTNVTLKTYVNGVALPYQPTFYCASAQTYTLSYTDVKTHITAGTKTVEVKAVTDANAGVIAIGHAVMWVQMFAYSFPTLSDPTGFSSEVISDVQINLAWTNPTSVYFGKVEVYRYTSTLAAHDRAWCNANATAVYDGTATSYNNTGLTASTAYYYKIFGVYIVDEVTYYGTGVVASGTTQAPAGPSVGYMLAGFGPGAMQDTDGYAPDTWTNKTDMPSPARSRSAAEMLSDKIYIMGGVLYKKDCDEYTPDTWASKTDLTTERQLCASFAISDNAYLCTGTYYDRVVQEYAPDTWTNKTDTPPPGRNNSRGSAISDKGYIYGGQNAMTDCDEYTPDTWASKTSLPSPGRDDLCAVTLGSKAYIMTGADNVGLTDNCEEYAPDTWSAKTDVVSPIRSQASSFVAIGKIYITGGSDSVGNLRDCDEYAPDTWANKTDIPTPARYNSAGSSI